jgi:hypothetical protein
MARGTPSQPPLRSEGTRRCVGASSWKIHGGSMLRLATASPDGHRAGACGAVSSSANRRWCALSRQHAARRLRQQHQEPAAAMPAAEEAGDAHVNRPKWEQGVFDARAQRACSRSGAEHWNAAQTAHAPAQNGRVPHAPAATPLFGRRAARGAPALPPRASAPPRCALESVRRRNRGSKVACSHSFTQPTAQSAKKGGSASPESREAQQERRRGRTKPHSARRASARQAGGEP